MKGLDNAELCPECGAKSGYRRPVSHVYRAAGIALLCSLLSIAALFGVCGGLNIWIVLPAWPAFGLLTFAFASRASRYARESGSHPQLFPIIGVSEFLAFVPIGLALLGLLLWVVSVYF